MKRCIMLPFHPIDNRGGSLIGPELTVFVTNSRLFLRIVSFFVPRNDASFIHDRMATMFLWAFFLKSEEFDLTFLALRQ